MIKSEELQQGDGEGDGEGVALERREVDGFGSGNGSGIETNQSRRVLWLSWWKGLGTGAEFVEGKRCGAGVAEWRVRRCESPT
jgi:hypothetical protein